MTMKYLTEVEQMQAAIDKVQDAIRDQNQVVREAKEKYDFAREAVFWLSKNLLRRKSFYEHSQLVLNHLNQYYAQLIVTRNELQIEKEI